MLLRQIRPLALQVRSQIACLALLKVKRRPSHWLCFGRIVRTGKYIEGVAGRPWNRAAGSAFKELTGLTRAKWSREATNDELFWRVAAHGASGGGGGDDPSRCCRLHGDKKLPFVGTLHDTRGNAVRRERKATNKENIRGEGEGDA